MNKKHQSFLSTVVFISVFFLSAIFYFTALPNSSQAPVNDAAKEAMEEAKDTDSENTPELQSYSYTQKLVLIEEDLQERQTADSSNAEKEEDVANEETDEAILHVQSMGVDASSNAEAATVAPGLYANLGISIADHFVYVRKKPSTDSEALGKLYKDSAATILRTEGEWYLVESGSITGYIKSEYLRTDISDEELMEKYGQAKVVVDVNGLNVRKQPNTEADRVDVIYKNESYPVLEADDTWVKIDIEDDKIKGYVMREYVRLIVEFKEAHSMDDEQDKAKKETQGKKQKSVSYSKEDLKLLACLVHAEAGSQSYEGKLAVANVVLNRVKSSEYPDTIKKVIYQSGQFSVAESGSLQKQLNNYYNYNSNSQLLSIKAAREALMGSNNIGSRLYFHSYRTAVNKGYKDKKTAVKIGGQLFW